MKRYHFHLSFKVLGKIFCIFLPAESASVHAPVAAEQRRHREQGCRQCCQFGGIRSCLGPGKFNIYESFFEADVTFLFNL